MEVVLASSSVDDGIGCWDIHTGAEQPRYKSCSSPFHGLVSLGPRFLASSQLQHSSSTSGSVFFWSFSKVFNSFFIFLLICYFLSLFIRVKSL
jgi:pre-rRNA-processing protein IPI3